MVDKMLTNVLIKLPGSTVLIRGARRNFFRWGGKRCIYYLLYRIKLYSCNQDFAKVLEPKVKWSCSKNVAIGRHLEQINVIQLAYIMDGGPEAKSPVQARSQKFAMGGLFWESGGGAPSARKFCIFLQNNLILELFLMKNNAFKTLHRNWQRNMI